MDKKSENMKNIKLQISGMSCVNCSNSIESYLKSSEGVKSVTVDFMTGRAAAEYDESLIDEKRIFEMVSELGFGARQVTEDAPAEGQFEPENAFGRPRILTAIVFALPVFVLNMFFCHLKYSPLIMSVLTLPVLFYCGAPFHKKAFITVKNRLPLTMDALISASAFSSFLLSVFMYYAKGSHEVYFDSSASIIAIILCGKALEEKMKRKSKRNLGGIIEGMPEECTLEKDGNESAIKVSEIKAGDTLIIKPNQKVAVDSIILRGEGFVENSAITGESAPLYCREGDTLWAGSQNSDAIFKVRAVAEGRDSYINRIESMLNQALFKKARIQKTADAIASWFVPAIFALASLTLAGQYFLFSKSVEFSILAAISVIAIACPCALGLALPTAFYFGANTAAVNGILFTDPDSLHAINEINALVFDKTGTLTQNRLKVKNAEFHPAEGTASAEILRIIASVERFSDHPAAKALNEYAAGASADARLEVCEYQTHGGSGISAVCEGKKVLIGNKNLAGKGAESVFKSGAEGLVFYASIDGVPSAAFELEEIMSEGAAETVAQLKKEGIAVYLLTGDIERNAIPAAKACGIDPANVRFSMKPDEKADFIKQLKKNDPRARVAMVGDGVNDALSMACANIAIAMADATNIAKTAANIILTGSGLKNAVKAIRLGKKMRSVILQNFFWAFFYNVILIPSAMAARLNPMQAAFAMAASSVFVVLNSTRLKKL
ncbi:MAG: putative copper-importing P-type ATPase A [bacterium ADurb.Bin243]|nr:MAG: putative copper-importing P-type ATPase A [bacterium ADurb.Bin243]